MIGVSLDKLLDQVEVEWKALGKIGTFFRGKRFVRTDIQTSGVPCIHYGELYTHYGTSATDAKSFLDEKLASNLRYASHGDVIIVSAGETIEDIGNGTAWLGEEDVVIHDACFAYRSELNPAYVSHFLRTKQFKDQIRAHISSGKISSIGSKGLSQARIPVPCPHDPKQSLAVQAEIVRILDAFAELTAELTAELSAELSARKKHYSHHRDQLLHFEDGTAGWKSLGIVATIKTGQAINKQMIAANPGAYPVINSGREPLGFIDEWNTDDDPIGVTSRGAGVGSITWKDGKYFRGNLNYSVTIRDRKAISTRYLYHLLLKMQAEIQALCTFDGIPALNAGNLKKLQIPVPPLTEQERVAAILDKFDAKTCSLSADLTREIELRKKQHVYYRDLLLSFRKPEEVAG